MNKRPYIYLAALITLAAARLAPAASLPSSSVIRLQGRLLSVNGSSFTVRGVCYSPIPVGQTSAYDWMGNANTYNTDLPLISAMGANTVRTYAISTNTTNMKAFLDAAASNGLYVILGYWVQWTTDFSVAANRNSVVADFTNVVNQWKGHPAVLMWNFGNEVYDHTPSKAGWYSLLNEAGAAAHANDANHPVITAISDNELAYAVANSTNLPHVDAWGLNEYRGSSFGSLFTSYTTTKPFAMTEFGCDAYDTRISNSNETLQSDTEKAQWNELAGHFSASFSTENCLGGTLFEWCDEWWKGDSVAGDPSTISSGGVNGPNVQDTPADWINAAYADTGMNEEWWGMVAVSAGTYKRTLRKTYYTFLDLWGGSVTAVNNDDYSTSGSGLFQDEVRNFPNPFVCGGTSTTRIRFKVNGSPELKMEIFDLSGRKLRELTGITTVGNAREAFWDGRDSDQNTVPFGLYICKVKATLNGSEEVKYRKIAVIK